MDVLPRGINLLFRGVRRSNLALTGVGAALSAIGLISRLSRPKRELIWAKRLKPGEAYRIRLLDTGEEIDVEG